ncbi:hypothetical protein [Nodosilinea nodulosa]|uniref:hypothetical protein n=1 Tax=Nodosilinea nodulosa TaxID=416001 RepID=UPI001CEC730D|nr:hypothetical protein [Nodosilinea nodulosa]
MLEQVITEFGKLADPSHDQSLNFAWHFLQVYSTWGLRLPNTEELLKLFLGISEPAKYLFFGNMKDGYDEIYHACLDFQVDIFPEVIEIGTNILSFALKAQKGERGIFTQLSQLIGSKPAIALKLITKLQRTTQENADHATEVGAKLAKFKADLDSALQKHLKPAKAQVEEDEKTSKATIETIAGGAEAQGSLKQLQDLLASEWKEYNYDVKVAATTPTYAWVPIIGTIPAVVVAGVYGDRAVHHLKQAHRYEEEIKQNNQKLSTAIQAQTVHNTVDRALVGAQRYTDLAIAHTNTVQNAWVKVKAGLDDLKESVSNLTTESDSGKVLEATELIEIFLGDAEDYWEKLVPPLTALTDNPYIKVAPGDASLGSIADEVEKEVARLNSMLTVGVTRV